MQLFKMNLNLHNPVEYNVEENSLLRVRPARHPRATTLAYGRRTHPRSPRIAAYFSPEPFTGLPHPAACQPRPLRLPHRRGQGAGHQGCVPPPRAACYPPSRTRAATCVLGLPADTPDASDRLPFPFCGRCPSALRFPFQTSSTLSLTSLMSTSSSSTRPSPSTPRRRATSRWCVPHAGPGRACRSLEPLDALALTLAGEVNLGAGSRPACR